MMGLEQPMKQFFMYLSKSKSMNKAAKRWGLKFGASQVVAGKNIESAIKVVKRLNEKGLVCTLDHLGEFVDSKEEALEATQYCIKTLDAIAESGVKCNLSVKMTQLGLDISDEFCLENMRRIVQTAKDYDNFVRIDMEDFFHCQLTLDILAILRQEFDNVGTVIQAYLFRADQDIENLKGVSLRLVKGAYKESPKVAFQEKQQVDDNYLNIIKKHLLSGSYTAIATHDHEMIAEVKKFAEANQILKTQFEFQMLYGFRTNLQLELVGGGYTIRVYVPFGQDWYGYFMRRLAERPQNVSFALRGLISKEKSY
ncbi:proline dehydrogenase family protein [Alkalihalobacterium alkalinitrilicum]|uniref:proline dehydrogenase family protein n=1 Tax=Alkalihalobacterium alkalinitrilicum TaxID=427920 RepID=UPI0009955715|nr:proline dehydrogenase [Alkalihalobacterium alkalinitrilicum]